MKISKLFRRLMDAADDNGSTGTGGTAAADRGDVFVPAEAGTAAAETAAAAAEAAAAETAAAEAAAAEQARDASGKFAKKEKDDTGPVIPKARFDEQIAKERTRAEAAERRAEELEAAAAKLTHNLDTEKAVADVADLRKQERKAMLDGNEEKAAELSAQADRLNRQIAIAESGQMTSKAKDQAIEDMRFDLTLERLEDKYPELRAGGELYDQDLVDDVIDKQAGLIERLRLTPSKALAMAADQIMARRVAATAAAGKDAGKDADKDADKATAGLAAAKGDERKGAAVAKNLAAAAAQPGSLKEAGLDSDKAGQMQALPNVSDMTYEEFNALPEATRAKLRGDFS